MDLSLSILIPTYNRKEKLLRTLNSLNQQEDYDFDVYISDNASDYDIFSAIESIKENLKYKIHIHRNSLNIGADANIMNLFLLSDSEWVWPIADDDFIHNDAVRKIKSYCAKYNDASWLDFPVFYGEHIIDNDITFDSLVDYLSFSKSISSKVDIWGNMVYLANKVYSKTKIRNILSTFFYYNYTKISTSIILLKCLEKGFKGIMINDSIVDYDSSGEVRWSMRDICLGVRTYVDIDFALSKKEKKELYSIVAPKGGWLKMAVKQYMKNNEKISYPGMGLDVVYYDLYRKFLPFYEKPKYKFLVLITRYPAFYRIARRFLVR